MSNQEKINPRLIKSNIDQLSKIVKRPAVNEKILSRPPFRFLFDLTTMIIKTTGYLRGLYSDDEFNFNNVNANKETKMAFLDKLIDVIGLINGKAIDCKSAKIVAGVECEKTNKLLNEFAKCVLDKKPFVVSVEKVRKGQKNDRKVIDNSKEKITMTKASTTSDVKSKALSKQTTRSHDNKAKQTIPSKINNINKKIDDNEKNLKKENEKFDEKKESIIIDETVNEKPIINENQQQEQEEIIENTVSDESKIIENASSIDPNQNRPTTAVKNEIRNCDDSNDNCNSDTIEKNETLDIKTKSIIDDFDDVLRELSFNNDNENSSPLPSNKQEELRLENQELPKTHNDFKNNDEEDEERNLDNDKSNKLENNQFESSTIIDATKNDLTQTQPQVNNESSSSTSLLNDPNTRIQPNRVKQIIADNNDSFDTKMKSRLISDRIKSDASVARSARPKSSRPAPPRVMTASRSRLTQVMENRTEQLGSESTAANATIWIPETVDDDNDEFLISSRKLQDSLLTDDSTKNINNNSVDEQKSESKGHLVQQLMATKNELEGQIKDSNDIDVNKVNIKQTINNTDQLKHQIQSLCQSIGTLTKAMGYLHEDVEPMLDELGKWREEYNMNDKIIQKIRTEMNNDLEPLRKELEQIERQVDDFSEQIRMIKSNVFRNEQMISNLINNI